MSGYGVTDNTLQASYKQVCGEETGEADTGRKEEELTCILS
jgi:hypothetical protein